MDQEKHYSIHSITFDFNSVIQDKKIVISSSRLTNDNFSFLVDIKVDLNKAREAILGPFGGWQTYGY